MMPILIELMLNREKSLITDDDAKHNEEITSDFPAEKMSVKMSRGDYEELFKTARSYLLTTSARQKNQRIHLMCSPRDRGLSLFIRLFEPIRRNIDESSEQALETLIGDRALWRQVGTRAHKLHIQPIKFHQPSTNLGKNPFAMA
jgi:hypothetical protein